ncbi:MAG: peptidylprolyl isomerase [bacterium]|nr:peptidylprolyl isomerase [bacterium]
MRPLWIAALFVTAGALGVALVGCGENGPTPSLAGLTKIEPAETEGNDDFAWPNDPSHPVLELQIETPEQEGTVLIELMPELAPATVVNVIDLANEGYYDGTTFHRVIPGFMIQGGDPKSRDRDPTNDGTGGGENPLPDEFSAAPYLRGVVGMGNRGRADSTSAQFFIMHADNRNLDGRYNTIGRVLDGMELVDDITRVAIDRSGRWGPKDRPIENVTITSVRPVGQVAAVRSAMELEQGAGEIALVETVGEVDGTTAESARASESSAPPAAPAADAAGQ